MPTWTKEQYADFQSRDSRNRGSAIIQKLKNDSTRQVDNRPKKTEMDAEMHAGFRITVTLLVADRRDRDCDGAYSTIQDCLIAAIGRLAKMDRLALRKLAKSEERRRGI